MTYDQAQAELAQANTDYSTAIAEIARIDTARANAKSAWDTYHSNYASQDAALQSQREVAVAQAAAAKTAIGIKSAELANL
jgi:hypothetical protein